MKIYACCFDTPFGKMRTIVEENGAVRTLAFCSEEPNPPAPFPTRSLRFAREGGESELASPSPTAWERGPGGEGDSPFPVPVPIISGSEANAVGKGVGGLGSEDVVWDATRCAHIITQLDEYFQGKRQTFSLSSAPCGTEFQQRVWQELARVPYGETVSYKQLAERIGRPGASRAVGRANATNPIAIVVPCHRVIGASGKLTGYAYGLSVKERLLQLERA